MTVIVVEVALVRPNEFPKMWYRSPNSKIFCTVFGVFDSNFAYQGGPTNTKSWMNRSTFSPENSNSKVGVQRSWQKMGWKSN